MVFDALQDCINTKGMLASEMMRHVAAELKQVSPLCQKPAWRVVCMVSCLTVCLWQQLTGQKCLVLMINQLSLRLESTDSCCVHNLCVWPPALQNLYQILSPAALSFAHMHNFFH